MRFLLPFLLMISISPMVKANSTEAEALRLKAFEYGQAEKPDFEKMFEMMEDSAELGDAESMTALGSFYSRGMGVATNEKKAFEWYLKGAERGNVTAQHGVGELYLQGRGVEKNSVKAREWFVKAAAQGHREAAFSAAYGYHVGDGAEKDEKKAFELYLQSAEKNYYPALTNLGLFYREGIAVPVDYVKSRQYYKRAVEAGGFHAFFPLAEYYEKGAGCELNLMLASVMYELQAKFDKNVSPESKSRSEKIRKVLSEKELSLADEMINSWQPGFALPGETPTPEQDFHKMKSRALEGELNAFAVLGHYFRSGYGVEKNLTKAVEIFEKASEAGNDFAKTELASIYRMEEAYKHKIDQTPALLEPCAKAGNDLCQITLSLYYDSKKDPDYGKAVEWALKAAEQGSSGAMYNVASYYANGLGVPKDDKKCFEWTLKSSQAGYALADLALGASYYEGRGTQKDLKKSYEHYQLAAKADQAEAFFYLSDFYANGRVVKKDAVYALALLQIADKLDSGVKSTVENIVFLKKKMSAKEIEKARSLSDSWSQGQGAPKKVARL